MLALLARMTFDLVGLALAGFIALVGYAVLVRVVGLPEATAAWVTVGLTVGAALILDTIHDGTKIAS